VGDGEGRRGELMRWRGACREDDGRATGESAAAEGDWTATIGDTCREWVSGASVERMALFGEGRRALRFVSSFTIRPIELRLNIVNEV